MEIHNVRNGVGVMQGLRDRGFWVYFTFVAVSVFVLLTVVDFVLQFMYGQDQPGLNLDVVWDIGINISIGLFSAGFAWKFNGDPWINRPDTIKLNLDD